MGDINFRKFIPDMDPEGIIRQVMDSEGMNRAQTIVYLRKTIPLEMYYQKKIKEELQKKYPQAFFRKLSQGAYCQGGIPDVMCIYKGHYFGFEVKRPIVGVQSELQKQTILQIRKAGGTAEFVSWPEDAIKIIDTWDKETGVNVQTIAREG